MVTRRYGFALENYSSAVNVSIFDGEIPVAPGEESLGTAPSLGFCSEASDGGCSLPSPTKRLQQLGGGFRRWGAEHYRAAASPPPPPQHLGWMTSQLYPLPHSTGISIPEQHRPSLAAALLLFLHQTQTSPSCLGRQNRGRGWRQGGSWANLELPDLSAQLWSVPESWGWGWEPWHPPPAKHKQCPDCHSRIPLWSLESIIQLQKKQS